MHALDLWPLRAPQSLGNDLYSHACFDSVATPMQSVMVFWLYSAEQYATRTPLCELVEHAQERGFNDEAVDVLCLFGDEHIPEADRSWLRQRNFHLRDVSALYRKIAARYPNLRRRYQNHFFECFLRWIVLKEYYDETPLLAWDADIFFNEKLSRLHGEFRGATFTCSSTCFVALSDARWLEVYGRELDRFEQSPDVYLTGAFARMNELRLRRPGDFKASFYGERIEAALTSIESWTTLFDFTPEEMFVDYLARAEMLPHHLPKGHSEYLLCPLPLILPQLAWVHPMGAGLEGMADGCSPADLEFVNGRYTIGGRPLAFLHFQGALFRACAAHQILHGILRDPAPIHDGTYCPPERRLGREVVDLLFDRRAETTERLTKAIGSREVESRWGNLYSERDIARNYLIQSDLRAMLGCYGLAHTPANLSVGKKVVTSPEEHGFVKQLAQFFRSRSFLQVEFTDTEKVRLVHHQPGNSGALVREITAADPDHGTQSRDAEAETVFNLGGLAQLPESELPGWLKELWRITGRNLWVTLPPTATRSESWWMARFFEAGFRRHPFSQLLRPFAAPAKAGQPTVLIFEKIPAPALSGRPLSIRDTSGDFGDPLRELGVRAEARLARYELAAAFGKDGETIVDAGCGAGFGSAMMARRFPNCRVVGIDSDAAAIDYARLQYGGLQPNLEFHVADLCEFVIPGQPSVDLVVCVDVLEEVSERERLLGALAKWMKAGARLVASAPNNAGSGNGFSLAQFSNLLGRSLTLHSTFRQIAGDRQGPTASRPLLKQVDSATVNCTAEAEWWIIAAQKPAPNDLTKATLDAQPLNPQTAEIARRFASEPRHRPDFREVRKTLHGDKDIYSTFQFPTDMTPIGYSGALGDPDDMSWLLQKAVHAQAKPVFGLEVGTFVGSTAVRLGQALRDNSAGHLLCVDSFTGSGEMWFLERFQRDLQFQNGRPRIYELWMENIIRHELTGTVLPWCLTSLAAAQSLAFLPWVVDFIFLDSAHIQDETYLEISAYWKSLKPGGLLAGDDYDSFPAVKHDVDRFVAATGAQLIRSPSGRLWGLKKPATLHHDA